MTAVCHRGKNDVIILWLAVRRSSVSERTGSRACTLTRSRLKPFSTTRRHPHCWPSLAAVVVQCFRCCPVGRTKTSLVMMRITVRCGNPAKVQTPVCAKNPHSASSPSLSLSVSLYLLRHSVPAAPLSIPIYKRHQITVHRPNFCLSAAKRWRLTLRTSLMRPSLWIFLRPSLRQRLKSTPATLTPALRMSGLVRSQWFAMLPRFILLNRKALRVTIGTLFSVFQAFFNFWIFFLF